MVRVPALLLLAVGCGAFRIKPKQKIAALKQEVRAAMGADLQAVGSPPTLHVEAAATEKPAPIALADEKHAEAEKPVSPPAALADDKHTEAEKPEATPVALAEGTHAEAADVEEPLVPPSLAEGLHEKDVKGFITTAGLLRSKLILSTAATVLPASWFANDAEVIDIPSDSVIVNYLNNHGRFNAVPITLAIAITLIAFLRFSLGDYGKKGNNSQMVGSAALTETEDNVDTGSIIGEGLTIAVPTVVMALLAIMNETVSTVALGRVGSAAELSAVGLCNMMFNCTYMSFSTGIAGVLDTLVSQAFGAGNHHLSTIYLQRCRLLQFLQILWMWPLLWFAEPILLFLGQDPEIVALCGFYCKVNIPCAIMLAQMMSSLSFLRNRGDVLPSVWVFVVGNFFHCVCCILFVVQFGWGINGVALALFCNISGAWASCHYYLVCSSDCKDMGVKTLLFWDWSNLWQLGSYTRLALPAVISSCTEFWYWEINTLMLGVIGKVALAAHIGANNCSALLSMFVFGVSSATGTVVGRAIGGSQPNRAKATVYLGLIIVSVFWTFNSLFLVIFRFDIAYAYSNDPAVQKIMGSLFVLLAFSEFFNVSQGVAAGSLRGVAMQRVVAVTQFVAYYVFALGFGYCMTFVFKCGVYGIYYSFGLASLILIIIFTFILTRINWHSKVDEALERMSQEVEAARVAEETAK